MTVDLANRLAEGVERLRLGGQRVLALVPDTTRTAPTGRMVRAVHAALRDAGGSLDVMVALGTHPPLSRAGMLAHLGMTERSYARDYAPMRLMNHRWDDPASLARVGVLDRGLIRRRTDGRMDEDVPVTINKALTAYDHVLILGPVFPHEVAGFSGGAKYLFPGVSGPEFTEFTHWLAAIITTSEVIGRIDNPVRRLLHEAAKLVPVPVSAASPVVDGAGRVEGLFVGPMEASWRQAAVLSARLHVRRVGRRYRTVLSCAPPMYRDMWVAAKCMYKCEPVVADGGELIVYGPHVDSLSHTHGPALERLGFHLRDYFLAHADRLAGISLAVMAMSAYLKGRGTYDGRTERPRIRVTLATGIGEPLCRKVGLGYRDPADIDVEAFAGREDDGVLLVRKGGETLYLPDPPAAGEEEQP